MKVYKCDEGYMIASSIRDAELALHESVGDTAEEMGIAFELVPDDTAIKIHDEDDPGNPVTKTAAEWVVFEQGKRGILCGFNG